VREAIAQALSGTPGYVELASMAFNRPVAAQHWLSASNPSERWKWDFMFQDLPPVKFGDLPPVKFGEDFGPLPRAEAIPLKEME